MLSSRHSRNLLAGACAPFLLAATFTVAFGQIPQPQDVSAFGAAGAHCIALRYADFRETEDAPAQITSAQVVKGVGKVPDFCAVEGYVWRDVRFLIQFPLHDWNGKMVLQGNGGQGGYLPNANPFPRGPHQFATPLERHYAVIGHDSGHFSTLADTLWGRDNTDALIDYGFRAGHVTNLIGKAVLARFYGQSPAKSYYFGCSNSGREALMEAEHFPWHFNGIIAGDASLAVTNLTVNFLWDEEHLQDQSRSGFDETAAITLHKAVLAQCGATNGVINDPRSCKIDFRPLLCRRAPAKDCLTEHQIQIARAIYDGARRPDGSQIVPSSALPGSELMWVPFATPGWVKDYPADLLRNLLFDPPAALDWTPDPAKLADYVKRTGVGELLSGAEDPDIRTFKSLGGKLIMYYGWSDAFGGVHETMDYYETVERVMGGQKRTDDFFRLFMIPGMNHCGGGAGASEFDWLGAMDKWVETGEAPASVRGYHPGPDGDPQFWRTVSPFHATATP